jgi:hypothetical protein
MKRQAWMIGLLIGLCLAQARMDRAQAEPDAGKTGNLFFQAAYLREPGDRPWQFRIAGNVPSLPGCYLFVHGPDRLLLKRHLPHGRIVADKPLVLDMPADGVSGDYRVVIVGYQDDTLHLNLPLTTLPQEVYGRTQFAARTDGALCFRLPEGMRQMNFSASGGGLRVMQGRTKVADVKEQGERGKSGYVAKVALSPGVDYRLEPHGTFYFGVKEGIFLTTDPRRWFVPDATLDEVKWWRL